MAEIGERSWSDAIDMYERRATVAKVTSREHENWVLDLSTLMRGDTRDARGWRTVDKPFAGPAVPPHPAARPLGGQPAGRHCR
ncbi:hypothetical protein OHS71_12135 [Streptomyces sp. NBC_00377]|uniref:hypothetical protein n=1 Tax=unclassified Streptomyces TaxID=2593676 RepID=UPI002E213857|nr:MULTISPECIES: hypothetical protein [unclassified Streptomyces]